MNPQIYVAYNRALALSQDDTVSMSNRTVFRKAGNMLFGEQALLALNHLCKARALAKLWDGDDKPFDEITDDLAMALIGDAQTLEALDQIRDGMGPWAKSGVASVLLVARAAGLKTMVPEKSK